MAKGVLQSIPVMVLLALYAYLFWFFTFDVGFFRLSVEETILVVLTIPPFIAGAWFILGEGESWKQVALVAVLLILPLLYLGLLILVVVLHLG
ncbi:MAG: hypothetical protein ABSA50_00980 [Candidatus Bathyarchaeia archaeon]